MALKPVVFDADKYRDTMADAMDLSIDPAWRPAVSQNLVMLQTSAAFVMEFPLTDEMESTLVFKAL